MLGGKPGCQKRKSFDKTKNFLLKFLCPVNPKKKICWFIHCIMSSFRYISKDRLWKFFHCLWRHCSLDDLVSFSWKIVLGSLPVRSRTSCICSFSSLEKSNMLRKRFNLRNISSGIIFYDYMSNKYKMSLLSRSRCSKEEHGVERLYWVSNVELHTLILVNLMIQSPADSSKIRDKVCYNSKEIEPRIVECVWEMTQLYPIHSSRPWLPSFFCKKNILTAKRTVYAVDLCTTHSAMTNADLQTAIATSALWWRMKATFKIAANDATHINW